MGSKRCFLIGHRSVPESIRSLLYNAIERHISAYGVEEFYVGRYGQFDRMATQALVDAKAIFPHIRLYLLTPYHPSERSLSLPAGFDGSHYPFERAVPRRVAIVAANRAMVDYCDFLITYARYPRNAREFLYYAQNRARKGSLHILNLAVSSKIRLSIATRRNKDYNILRSIRENYNSCYEHTYKGATI